MRLSSTSFLHTCVHWLRRLALLLALVAADYGGAAFLPSSNPSRYPAMIFRGRSQLGYPSLTNAAANLQSGDVLYVSPGDHPVIADTTSKTPIYLSGKTNITIYGDGPQSRITYANERNVIQLDGCTNIVIRDLAIVATVRLDLTNHNYLWAAIFLDLETSYCRFENLLISGAPNHGISKPTGTKKCAFNTVTGCTFEDVGDDRYGDERLTLNMTLTGTPSAGNSFVIYLQANANTNLLTYSRYWTNNGTASGYNGTAGWIQAGTDWKTSTTNAYTFLLTNLPASVTVGYSSASNLLFSMPNVLIESATNDVTGTYAVDSYALGGGDGTAISGIGEGWLIERNRFLNCLRDVEIENLGQAASLPRNIRCVNNYHENTWTFCYWIFSDTTVQAVTANPYIGNILIANNVVRNNSNQVMRIDGGYNLKISDNVIEGSTNAVSGTGNGIAVLSASSRIRGITISGNTITGMKSRGISVNASTYPSTNVLIMDNYVECYGGAYAGIELNAVNALVRGNHVIVNRGGSANACITVHDTVSAGGTNTSANVLLDGNTLHYRTNGVYVAPYDGAAYLPTITGIFVQAGASNITVGANQYLDLYLTNQVFVRTNGAATDERNIRITSPFYGLGSPEGVLVAPVGTVYMRTDGGAGATIYVKETTSNYTNYHGWAAR